LAIFTWSWAGCVAAVAMAPLFLPKTQTRAAQVSTPDLSSEANTAPFCSIAQTVAHLLILRLTFYIPTHSSLFFCESSLLRTNHSNPTILRFAFTPRPRGVPVWILATLGTSPVHARPVEAPTSRFDSRGCPVHRHPRPRAEEAGRTSSTRLLQLAGVERLPRAMNEIWYQGSETPWSGRRVTRVVS
jgi:hypothetical protein